jgi:hypothetical protein
MANRYRLYFDKPVDERAVVGLLNQEFDSGVVDLIKVDVDKTGNLYALISADSDIPMPVLDMLGNRRISVTSVVRESKKMKEARKEFTMNDVKTVVDLHPHRNTLMKAGKFVNAWFESYRNELEPFFDSSLEIFVDKVLEVFGLTKLYKDKIIHDFINLQRRRGESVRTLTIKEDVRVPGTDIILEEGEEIEILEATYKTAPEILNLVLITLKRYNIEGTIETEDRNGGVVNVSDTSKLDRSWDYVLEDLQVAQDQGTIAKQFTFSWDQDGDEKIYVDNGSGVHTPETFEESTKKNLNEARAPYQLYVTHKSEDGGRTWEPVTAPAGFSIEEGAEIDPMEWQENSDGSGSFIAAKQSEETPSYYNGSVVYFDSKQDLRAEGWRI